MNRALFIGLGNPGDQYHQTRHNAGWMVLDTLVEKWQDPSVLPTWKYEKKVQAEVLKLHHEQWEIIFLKPQTFMNKSGESALAACKWFLNNDPSESPNTALHNVVVFHDDLDIELGKHKLQFNSGPKVHNGVNSVRSQLGTSAFWTARLGVDSRQGDRSMPGHAYVMQKMTPDEQRSLRTITELLAEELPYTVLQ